MGVQRVDGIGVLTHKTPSVLERVDSTYYFLCFCGRNPQGGSDGGRKLTLGLWRLHCRQRLTPPLSKMDA